MKKFRHWAICLAMTAMFCRVALCESEANEPLARAPIKIGWIGSMTGPLAKWGAYQAALLAQDEVNARGGVKGRQLEIVFEDAHADGKAAVSAFEKLTALDRVSFVLGGHCTPESLAIAPLAERKKILTIASITSTPKLTNAGDYIFRVTPVSIQLADVLAPYAYKVARVRKLAILYENTDYVQPPAERLSDLFKAEGGSVTSIDSFNREETDFRSILLRISAKRPDALYFGVQSPDTALVLARQFRQLGLSQKLFSNEQVAGAVLSASEPHAGDILNGVVFAEPVCDLSSPATSDFAKRYNERFHTGKLPFGCYTAEPYDAVKILTQALAECDENVECVKQAFYRTKNYSGASGVVTFDKNGDVSKTYVLKKITDGEVRGLE